MCDFLLLLPLKQQYRGQHLTLVSRTSRYFCHMQFSARKIAYDVSIMKLWLKIVLAIVCGVITGLILGPKASYLKPIGTLFLNLLHMVIVPLIFASMTCAIANTTNRKQLGRVGITTCVLYAITTLLAIGFGFVFSSWLELGKDLHFTTTVAMQAKEIPPFSDLLLSIVPKNPIQSFADGNILQIIIFAIFLGVCINLVREKAAPLLHVIEALSQVMFRMTSLIMSLSPFGVFALMAWAVGSFGAHVLLPVFEFLISYYAASLIFCAVVYCGILFFLARLSPLPFFAGMTEAIGTAVSTCSSAASLAANIQCATSKLGISKNLASFVLPLGCSLNMNGSALFQVMGALFIAQAYGIELHMQQLIVLATSVILATLGTASIPGGGIIMLSIVFASVGIPLEGIAILASIDRLRDMATTTLNITGDTVCAILVAKQEGELDEALYYGQKELSIEQSLITEQHS